MTLLAEVFGTAILGGCVHIPLRFCLWECRQGRLRFMPMSFRFLISTAGGAILSGILLGALRKTGILKTAAHQIGGKENVKGNAGSCAGKNARSFIILQTM